MKIWTASVACGAAVGALFLSVLGTPAFALDGKTLFVEKGCPTCHGPDGGAPIAPNYPKLKGQNADYLIVQLKAFRSGERKGPQVALMQPMALTLTDEESEVVAKYLQSLQ
jgi:cytochrome c